MKKFTCGIGYPGASGCQIIETLAVIGESWTAIYIVDLVKKHNKRHLLPIYGYDFDERIEYLASLIDHDYTCAPVFVITHSIVDYDRKQYFNEIKYKIQVDQVKKILENRQVDQPKNSKFYHHYYKKNNY